MCVLLQGIPFELNMKANTYLTICDNLHVFFYNSSPFQKKQSINSSKYEVLVPIGTDLQVRVNDSDILLKNA